MLSGQRGQGLMTSLQPSESSRGKYSNLYFPALCILLALTGIILLRAVSPQQYSRAESTAWSTTQQAMLTLQSSPQLTRRRGMNIGYPAKPAKRAALELPAAILKGGSEDTWSEGRTKLRNRQMEEFRPGEPWLDDNGILIQAHGGGVIFHDGRYYWFGEHKAGATYVKYSEAYSPPRVDVIGVGCYSSTDLLHWSNEGLALKARTHPDLEPANVLERPKVLFHRKSQRFVMWMHIDTGDYEWARVGVATAEHVTGPYTYLRSFRPHNQQSRDLTVFQDEDDSAYIAYSSEDNAVMHVAHLTPDYLDIQPEYKRILILYKREAPALFKYKQYYLLLTSGCTGWSPNRAEIFYATSVMGEWKTLGNPSAGGTEMDRAYTFFSQPTYVVPVHGKPGRFVFMADQWDTTNLGASRYVWLPMWVDEVSDEDRATAQAEWLEAREKHFQSGGSIWYTLPPGPLHIVVPWLDAWKPDLLDQPLDPDIKRKHWEELRTYPAAFLQPPPKLVSNPNHLLVA